MDGLDQKLVICFHSLWKGETPVRQHHQFSVGNGMRQILRHGLPAKAHLRHIFLHPVPCLSTMCHSGV